MSQLKLFAAFVGGLLGSSFGSLFIAAVVVGQDVQPEKSSEIQPAVSVRFANRATDAIPDFQKHVVPLLGRAGCNSAKCHGSFQGQGDFRLSLFGFDFSADHASLHAEASSEDGRRLNPGTPGESLIVRKPTEQTDHEGGKRIEVGSWEHHLLLRWIETGI